MITVSKTCNRCKQTKPLSEFYKRSGTRGYVSECKDCMKQRSKDCLPLPPTQPRQATEAMAINYLKSKGIFAAPGKSVKTSHCDVVAWGCIGIEVKYGVLKRRGLRREFYFTATPIQKKRGFIGQLVMLICDPHDGSEPTFHLFKADDPVFYIWRDGEPGARLKTGFTYFRGRTEALKHGDNRVVMTDAMMDAAQDNIALIWETMATISRELMGA